MKRHILLVAVAAVVVAAAGLPPVKAQIAGGQTIGGGNLVRSLQPGAGPQVLFSCNGCDIPACLTYSVSTGGPVTVTTFDAALNPTFTETLNVGEYAMRCDPNLSVIEVDCPGALLCRVNIRVDQVGPFPPGPGAFK